VDRETLSHKINQEISFRNIIWTFAFIVSSGTISLIFHLNTPIEKVLFALGFIISLGLFNGASKKEDEIDNLIKKYERSK